VVTENRQVGTDRLVTVGNRFHGAGEKSTEVVKIFTGAVKFFREVVKFFTEVVKFSGRW
jgi:hypothetical protein